MNNQHLISPESNHYFEFEIISQCGYLSEDHQNFGIDFKENIINEDLPDFFDKDFDQNGLKDHHTNVSRGNQRN
jgi:hypothetical protein